MNKKYLIMIGTALLIFSGMCAVITGCGEEQIPESTPGSSDTWGVNMGVAEREEEPDTTGQTTQTTQTEQTPPSEQTDATREEETQTQSKDETTGTTEVTAPQSDTLTFEEYLQMSSKEQRAYFDSYEDPMQFLAWFDAAQADYIRDNPAIEVTGPIDFGDLIGKQP